MTANSIQPASSPASDGSANSSVREAWVRFDERREKYVHVWGEDSSAPTVCILHGLGEHGGRYHRLATDLVSRGFQVIAFDQQGHGLSPEKRGCIDSYHALMDDIEAVVSWIAKLPSNAHPLTPGSEKVAADSAGGLARLSRTILFGHSMGGNLVLNYALRKSLLPAAVVSSSPMIEAASAPNILVESLLRSLMRVRPNWRLSKPVRPERIMSDPNEQELMRRDELFHSQLSLRLGASLIDSGRWLLKNASQLNVPTLLTHGTDDALTKPTASEKFAEHAGDLCRFELLPGHKHDPFRDVERDQVIDLLAEFMHDRIRDQVNDNRSSSPGEGEQLQSRAGQPHPEHQAQSSAGQLDHDRGLSE